MAVDGKALNDQGLGAGTVDGPTLADARGSVPPWLGTLAGISWRLVVVVALGVVLVAIAVLLTNVTAAILVAFMVAAFFAPLDERLRARGWNPSKASAATSVVALVSVLGVAVLVVVGLIPAIADILRVSKLGATEFVGRLQEIGLSSTAIGFVTNFLAGAQQWIGDVGQAAMSRMGDVGTVLILGGFLTFYVLESGDRAWGDVARDLAGTHYDDLNGRASLALDRVGRFMRGTMVMASIDAITDLVFLLLLGVPEAAPLAALVFIGGFIPYIGAIFTVMLLVLATWGSVGAGAAALLFGLIVVVNIFQAVVTTPRVYGSIPRVSPALVIIALPAGATLFGILGLIVAVPVVAAVTTLLPAIFAMLNEGPSEDRGTTLVPLWLDRLGEWSWRALAVIAALALVIAGLLQVPIVTLPAILAGVLAATLRPVLRRLQAAGLGPTAASAIATLGSAALVGMVIAITVVSIAGSAPDIVASAKDGADKTGLGGALGGMVAQMGEGIDLNTAALLGNLLGVTLAFLMVMFITFFLLRDGSTWWKVFLGWMPDDRRRPLSAIVGDSADVLSGYMIGTGGICLFAGVTAWLMMSLLGLPLALPVGILTFFLSWIPYIGDFAATGLAFLVAIAVGSTSDIILMAVYTLVINIVQGNIVAPLVYKRTVSLPPAIVLLAAPAGAAIGGIMGMFLVVPFLGVIATTWRSVLRLFDPAPETSVDDGPDAGPDADLVDSVSAAAPAAGA